MPRVLALLASLGLALALVPEAVGAHALYDHSDPPAGAVLPASPPALSVWFAEKLDPGNSGLTLYGPAGQVTAAGAPSPMADDPQGLTWPLPALDPGVYTVAWATRSAEDGDDATGFYAFAVGQPTTAGAPLALPAQAAGDLRVGLTLAPAAVGMPRVTATVRDAGGQPVPIQRVFARLTPAAPSVGQAEIVLAPTGPDTFAADLLVGLPGDWRIDVRVRRETADDVATVFTVPFAAGQSAASAPITPATASVASTTAATGSAASTTAATASAATATVALATATAVGAAATATPATPPTPTPAPPSPTPPTPLPTPVPATPTPPPAPRPSIDQRAVAAAVGGLALLALLVSFIRRRR